MLETIREFGLECLRASGEEDATRRAHAAWCVALAEQEWDRLVHEGWRTDRLDRLAADYDNRRAAAAWLEQTGDGEGLLRLVGCLGEFWMGRGHRREGRAWLERALDPARSAAAPAAVRARALHAAAWLAANRSDHDAALRQGSEAMALWRELGDRQGMAQALSVLGLAALTRGDYDAVAVHAGEAEALAEELGDGWLREPGNRWLMAVATVQLGAAAFGRGDLARAAALLEEAIARFGERGELAGGVWWAANYLALVECARGDRAEAAARFAANLALWRTAGRREPLADTLAGVATLAAASGAPEPAARLFGAAEALRDLLGYAVLLPERAAFERGASTARIALGDAAFAAAEEAGRSLSLEQAMAEAAAFLASVAEQPTPVPSVAPADRGPAAGLTPREREVLRLLAEGLTDREIAGALFVGPGTVRTHLTSIFGKLDAGTRTAAVTAARRLGLL
jgi:non-specific serine/threonine protein kinase